MLYEIFKFELQYRAKRLDTYLFFAILLCYSMVSFNFIFEGHNIGLVKENAPYITAKIMAISAGIFMIITSMVMGVPILRDFEYQTAALIYINPIKKRDYLLGRFSGSFVVLVFIFSGLIWGIILGEQMPWRDPDNLLPFYAWSYLNPFLTLVLPTLFFSGSLFFVTGTLSRNLMVVYTQGVLFFVVFILSSKIDHPTLAAILEPFSFRAIDQMVQAWSLEERNTQIIPMEGVYLYNRILWLLIGVVTLIIGYTNFNFNLLSNRIKKKVAEVSDQSNDFPKKEIMRPTITFGKGILAKFIQLIIHSIFYFKSIFKEVSFWSILICGIAIIFINSISLGTIYGVDSYPTTYLIVEELQESSLFFFLIILIFYSGELIWKERDTRIHLIYDATPASDFILLAGKFIGLVGIYIFLLFVLILSGILFQTSKGYFQYEPSVYFTGFFLEIFPFLILYTFISFFIHVLVNSKYLGHLLTLIFFMLSTALGILEIGHPLLQFGGIPLGKYSDMNGYGHLLKPYLAYQGYWLAFCVGLFSFTTLLTIRGTSTSRWQSWWNPGRQQWSKSVMRLGAGALAVFLLIGIYIFYHTNIRAQYWSASTKLSFRADYEKILKSQASLLHPKLVEVTLKVDLYPAKRNYVAAGSYLLTNPHDVPIQTIFLQKWVDQQIELRDVSFAGGARIDSSYQKYDYLGYTLNRPLHPGDSITMSFVQTFTGNDFLGGSSSKRIVYNGIFLDNQQLPHFGYNRKFEIRDAADRKAYGLLPRTKTSNVKSFGKEDYEINLDIIVGTDSSQIAIAPGNLQRAWSTDNRRYYHYKMGQPMMNLYSINSGRFQVLKDQWIPKTTPDVLPVALEIYHHPGHEYNLQRMMYAMKQSLDYYSTQFSPYQYQQMRIIEFPRYIEFAQSFPNMVPFSEAIGFVMDIDNEKEVDIAFFVTAHELAHQWWGHQVTVSEVPGWSMVIESLAQYSALMVLQESYPEEKVRQFLRTELDSYLKKRMSTEKPEVPLYQAEDQDYIYYQKGALSLYALQDYISSEKVNLALRRFIRDWNVTDGVCKKERYPEAADLLEYFREVTPDRLQYIITDLFETITLYDNRVMAADYAVDSVGQYRVTLTINAQKYRLDSVGIETEVEMGDWVDLGVYAEGVDGEEELIYLEKRWICSGEMVVEIFVNREPDKVGIDPCGLLIDKDRRENFRSLGDGD